MPAGAEPVPNAGPVSPLVKRPAEYDAVQRRPASGWNTYENDSVLSHVLMPDGLAIRLGLEKKGDILSDALIGREEIVPGARTWNGDYTELELSLNDANKTLTVGKRQGSFPGMLKERTFNVIMSGGRTAKVVYNGDRQTVRL